MRLLSYGKISYKRTYWNLSRFTFARTEDFSEEKKLKVKRKRCSKEGEERE